MYGIEVEGHFDAAHFLANYHGKCENLHGHRYRVVVTLCVDDTALQREGTEEDMVMDFSQAKACIANICSCFDHTFLLEKGSLQPSTVAALEKEGFALLELPYRTTAENLAHDIFDRCMEVHLPVSKVEVDETPQNRAFYEPNSA